MTPADRLPALMQILKEEYGIETPEQLYEAVKQLGGIDITPFVAKLQNGKYTLAFHPSQGEIVRFGSEEADSP